MITVITVTLILSIRRKGSKNVMKFIGTASIAFIFHVYGVGGIAALQTQNKSEYVNTYCLIILLLFILDIINNRLVLVEPYNVCEHI